MDDQNEKYWVDLVAKLKADVKRLDPALDRDQVALHNRIWEAISEAFRRGQATAK